MHEWLSVGAHPTPSDCANTPRSRRANFFYAFELKDEVDLVTNVLASFMSYLDLHDVCPEYREDVLKARSVCYTGKEELWNVAQARRWLPGDFNIACCTLFGGSYAENFDGRTNWAPEQPQTFIGMTHEVASTVCKYAIAGVAADDVYEQWLELAVDGKIEVVETKEEIGLEITEVLDVTEDTRDFYKENTKEFRPVGRIRCQSWLPPDAPPEDLTEAEKAEKDRRKASGLPLIPIEFYEFIIEEIHLKYLFVGMKMITTTRKLNCGIWYIDCVQNCFTSFDTYLPNELLYNYKEPKVYESALSDAGSMLD